MRPFTPIFKTTVTGGRASIDLALNLICRSEREKLNARSIFDPHGL